MPGRTFQRSIRSLARTCETVRRLRRRCCHRLLRGAGRDRTAIRRGSFSFRSTMAMKAPCRRAARSMSEPWFLVRNTAALCRFPAGCVAAADALRFGKCPKSVSFSSGHRQNTCRYMFSFNPLRSVGVHRARGGKYSILRRFRPGCRPRRRSGKARPRASARLLPAPQVVSPERLPLPCAAAPRHWQRVRSRWCTQLIPIWAAGKIRQGTDAMEWADGVPVSVSDTPVRAPSDASSCRAAA